MTKVEEKVGVLEVPALASGERPESGPMQFGNDWPGVFIRGDHALFFAATLDGVIASTVFKTVMDAEVMKGLRDTLMSCHVPAEPSGVI